MGSLAQGSILNPKEKSPERQPSFSRDQARDSKREKSLKKLKENENSINRYLKDYKSKFSQDLEEVWAKHDVDKNNMLDKDEAKNFIAEIKKLLIDQRKANNYDPSKFNLNFDKFDEDKNGFLSKAEMS